MKTRLSLVMLLLLMLFATSAYSEESNPTQFDFKRFMWSAALEEVVDFEGTYLASDKVKPPFDILKFIVAFRI